VIQTSEEEMEKPLAEEDGWQIARASFTRELMHYSVRGGIALAILGALVFAVFWAYQQMITMPPAAVNSAQKMMGPLFKALPFSGTASSTNNSSQSGAHLTADGTNSATVGQKVKNVSRHFRRHASRQIASRPGHGHVRPVQAGDNPTGGKVTYSDGMITEYSWK